MTLRVADRARADTGTLESWGLHVTLKSGGTVRATTTRPLPIPDARGRNANPTGLGQSSISPDGQYIARVQPDGSAVVQVVATNQKIARMVHNVP